MQGRIKILPETLANQIAAGEVVQRPASVIKELMENSIDANATKIDVVVRNGGKNLIQVIDNGIGMNPVDARMAFERHATSKIDKPEDLFNIKTKGFRGEALASIAAVSKVELLTKTDKETIGTRIVIQGGKLLLQEPYKCNTGANISVKNLFFNVPARRRFLKSDNTEFRHVLTEFYRIAIPHNNVEFSIIHNQKLIIKLLPSSLRERILYLFDRSYNEFLVPIEADLGFLKISGFITKPQFAKKTKADQYFFVNKRFMRNAYFHKAVLNGYANLLPTDTKPTYFIFFDIDPSMIDVNIHPTKTEINFQNAEQIFRLLSSSVKEALVKFKITPSIDFDNVKFMSLEVEQKNKIPQIKVNTDFNPFEIQLKQVSNSDIDTADFDKYIDDLIENTKSIDKHVDSHYKILIIRDKYIIAVLSKSVVLINIKRALQQINYEEIIQKFAQPIPSQRNLYPIELNFSPPQILILDNLKEQLTYFGFQMEKISSTSYRIIGKPEFMPLEKIQEFINDLIDFLKETNLPTEHYIKEKITEILAKNSVFDTTNFSIEEANDLISKLFLLDSIDYTFDGRKIIHRIEFDQIDKWFR